MRVNPKESINAPCGYFEEKGRKVYPAINCAYVCEACAWNPEEKMRRRREGYFVKKVVVDPDTDAILGSITQMHFPKNDILRKGELG